MSIEKLIEENFIVILTAVVVPVTLAVITHLRAKSEAKAAALQFDFTTKSQLRAEQVAIASELMDVTARLAAPYTAENWDYAWTEFCALYHGKTHFLDDASIWSLVDELDDFLHKLEDGENYLKTGEEFKNRAREIVYDLGIALTKYIRAQFEVGDGEDRKNPYAPAAEQVL